MNPLFQNIGANDAKDLLNFIIMTLHEELNRNLSDTNSNNNPLNTMNNNRIITYNLFLQDYNRTFKSKISDIFYAIQETETKCLSCSNIQYNCQAYFFLVFPLEEIKKYAINKINPPTNNNMNNMNVMNNFNNMNNISLNNNNINMNFNINFNMNNISGNINNNIYPNTNNSNQNSHRRANSLDLYNKNRSLNMNTNMNNMMMNAGNNLIMNNNNIFTNMMPNPNYNNYNMMSNMGMNFMNSNNNAYNNFNNYNMMNNNSFISMSINNQFNQSNFYNNNNGFGYKPNLNNMSSFNSFNSFNSMNSNLSNITMNNMFNMGMNSNINNASNINNNINNNISNNKKLQKLYKNIVDISDCFEYNSKTDFFTDSNQIYCNNCAKMSDAYYTTSLETAPKVLILLLNRGIGIQFKIKLEFPMELDVGKYINQKQANTNYKLIGVITHLGDNGESGHFIAHCLSPIDNEWYTYNDAIVSKIDDIKKQVVDLGMPYLLFYQRKE